jgi:Leucine-rich repeat (LRR) protein
LKNLNVKGNELKKLPENLYLLNQLEDLNIAYNPDLNFDDIAIIFEKMPFLKHLDISYNNFDLLAAKQLQKKIPNTKIAKDEVKGRYGQAVERKKK